MEDDFVDEAFLQDVEQAKDLTRKRQDTRGAKEGEITLTGSLESYNTKVKENGTVRNVSTLRPPKTEMVQTKDKKKTYPASLSINVRVTEVNLVPGESEPRTDGKPGWRVRATLHYFAEAITYFRDNLDLIWSDAAEQIPELMRMREYVDKEGNLAATRWQPISPGDQVKVKVGDRKDDNIFRKENPEKKGMLWVQPSTPIKFTRVIPEVFVNVINKRDDNNNNNNNNKKDEGAAAAADGEAAAEATATVAGDGPKIKVAIASPAYNCKGGQSISEDYDANLAETERLHDSADKNAHNMVPIADLRAKKVIAPASAYFYVKRMSQTPWNPQSDPNMKGVTIIRDTEPDTKDFMTEWQDVKKPTCNVRFDVYQWRAGDANKMTNK
jgi:hypothetical protein